MDAYVVTFPALIVAEDGWVDYLDSPARLSAWTTTAIKKYNKCHVMLYDQTDRAWLVESILPRDRRNTISLSPALAPRSQREANVRRSPLCGVAVMRIT